MSSGSSTAWPAASTQTFGPQRDFVFAEPEEIPTTRPPRIAGHARSALERRELRAVVVGIAEQRLSLAVATMALLQQRRGAVEVLVRKGVDFEARHRRRTIPLAP